MSKTILFMCPHGAAKSVMAMTYFQKLADEKGLEITAEAAGPFPDEVTNPKTVALMTEEGFDLSKHTPRKVTARDISQADKVVSLGCELGDLPNTDNAAITQIIQWDDVPLPSQGIDASWEKIKSKVEDLIFELS